MINENKLINNINQYHLWEFPHFMGTKQSFDNLIHVCVSYIQVKEAYGVHNFGKSDVAIF